MREQPGAVGLFCGAVEDQVACCLPKRQAGGRIGGHVEIVALEVNGGGFALDAEGRLVRRRERDELVRRLERPCHKLEQSAEGPAVRRVPGGSRAG